MNSSHTTECLARTRQSLADNLDLDWIEDDSRSLTSRFHAVLDEQVTDALADRMFCAEHGCNDQADDAQAPLIHRVEYTAPNGTHRSDVFMRMTEAEIRAALADMMVVRNIVITRL